MTLRPTYLLCTFFVAFAACSNRNEGISSAASESGSGGSEHSGGTTATADSGPGIGFERGDQPDGYRWGYRKRYVDEHERQRRRHQREYKYERGYECGYE